MDTLMKADALASIVASLAIQKAKARFPRNIIKFDRYFAERSFDMSELPDVYS